MSVAVNRAVSKYMTVSYLTMHTVMKPVCQTNEYYKYPKK
jgi:hypothetical protein